MRTDDKVSLGRLRTSTTASTHNQVRHWKLVVISRIGGEAAFQSIQSDFPAEPVVKLSKSPNSLKSRDRRILTAFSCGRIVPPSRAKVLDGSQQITSLRLSFRSIGTPAADIQHWGVPLQ